MGIPQKFSFSLTHLVAVATMDSDTPTTIVIVGSNHCRHIIVLNIYIYYLLLGFPYYSYNYQDN